MSPGHARPCDYRHSVEVQRSSFKRVDFSRVPLGKDTFASRKELPGPRSNIEDLEMVFVHIEFDDIVMCLNSTQMVRTANSKESTEGCHMTLYPVYVIILLRIY